MSNTDLANSVESELEMYGVKSTLVSTTMNLSIFKFQMGTISGTYGVSRDAILLIDVVNSNIGNGDFIEFLRSLEKMVGAYNILLYVIHLWNTRLSQYLIRRGYESNDVDGYSVVCRRQDQIVEPNTNSGS